MQQLDMKWRYRSALAAGIGFAKANVWSRAARRKKKEASALMDPDEDEPALGVKIHLKLSEEKQVIATIRWLQGRHTVVFESFCGMLKRHLTLLEHP